MTLSPALFSSATEEWSTPQAFFDELDRLHHFTLDPCATPANAKCAIFFTKEQDGLVQDWGTHRVFCNPPFGRQIGAWARKCYEASRDGALVVLLAPSRTCTAWWHEWVEGKADDEFVRGRLKFGASKENVPFPVMTATYLPGRLSFAMCGETFTQRKIRHADVQQCLPASALSQALRIKCNAQK
jgi:site-specific DNA-methyltransferase (adenine-specific)